MWRPHVLYRYLTGDHNIVHNCRGRVPLNSKLVNTLSTLREASNLDTSRHLSFGSQDAHCLLVEPGLRPGQCTNGDCYEARL